MTPKITLCLKDSLADVYSFATLYNYFVEHDFPAEFQIAYVDNRDCEVFESLLEKSVELKVVSGMNCSETVQDTSNLVLSAYSDVSGRLQDKNLQIDLSILKNCVKPLTEDKRKQLRQRYEIPEGKQILVVGCPAYDYHGDLSLREIVPKLYDDALIYMVGSINTEVLSDLVKEKAKIIEKYGVLRDYYSLADLAIINSNISSGTDTRHLHNFVEACEGGPLFLVKAHNDSQYGYRQLVNRGVLREAANRDDLISKVKEYLKSPFREEIVEQRKQHLEQSRELYLKDLMKLVKKLLRISNEEFESDLQYVETGYQNPEGKQVLVGLRVIHPETFWAQPDHQQRFNLKELSCDTLEEKCFRRKEELE